MTDAPLDKPIPHPHTWNSETQFGIQGLGTTDKPPNVYMDPDTGELLRSTAGPADSESLPAPVASAAGLTLDDVLRALELINEAKSYHPSDPPENYPLLAARAAHDQVTMTMAAVAVIDNVARIKRS